MIGLVPRIRIHSIFLKFLLTKKRLGMPCGKKRKRHKIATNKRKKRLRKNRHKKK